MNSKYHEYERTLKIKILVFVLLAKPIIIKYTTTQLNKNETKP